jgi:hypothetical protein
MKKIHEHGYWLDGEPHFFDPILANNLLILCSHATSNPAVIDFGCGSGDYVQHLVKHNIPAVGYDGNPLTADIPHCNVLDISQPLDLGYKAEWVISIEVGEHLPKKFESVFLDNLYHHQTTGIVMSWAVPGQAGRGHINCQPLGYIIDQMQQRGMVLDGDLTQILRDTKIQWLRRNLLAFKNGAR